jgi:hypothetical protein
MTSATAVSAIGSTLGSQFVAHEMACTGTTMSTAGKDADVINEIIFIRQGIVNS